MRAASRDVLLNRAAEIEAALVMMGGFGHAMEREFLFGSATRDIFRSTLETSVLLSHCPRPMMHNQMEFGSRQGGARKTKASSQDNPERSRH